MPAVDKFASYVSSTGSPARRGFAITPHDTDELPFVTRGIYVGNAGDVTVVLVQESGPVTFENVAAGSMLPVFVKQVLSTGTTATSLIGLH